MLVRAVVVHDPDFFGAGTRTNEGDLRGSDAGESAGKFVDDFVGELVREFADLGVGGVAAIDFGDDGLGGRIANIEHPGGDGDFGGGFGEITESDEVGVDGHVRPSEILQLGGIGEGLRRIKAGGDKVENAGEGEVVANHLGEERGVRLGRVGSHHEVGNGDAGLFDAEAGAGAEPTLFLLGQGEDWGE